MSILQEHWIKGVGWGKFNPVYNHQQAKYFTTHSLVDGTAIRANDGYYAFNEWIHVWIETGISGFIFLTLLTSCIGYLIVKNINRRNNWHSCILIPILVSSFFSYPLHNTLLFCLALFSVVGLGVTYIFKKKWLEFKYAKALAFALASIVSVVILLREGYIENTLSKAQSALEDEFKTEAYELLMKLENENLHSRSGDLLLFNLMYKTGRIEELIALFPKIHKRHCNQSLHSDLAKAYEEKREYVKAENHYFTALYIAPYRLQSRLDLMNFYWKKGDQQKAKYWAQQILDAPMKYITSEAIYIKRKAANFLQLPLQPTVNSL